MGKLMTLLLFRGQVEEGSPSPNADEAVFELHPSLDPPPSCHPQPPRERGRGVGNQP